MDLIRRYSLLATAIALGLTVLLGAIVNRPSVSSNAAKSLSRSATYFDSTVVLARNARPRGLRGDQIAIGLSYLERLRLGLGSPFRLTDEALRDPRLDAVAAPRVAWGVLARLRRGDAYVIDPTVFQGAGPRDADGAAHVAFIEGAVGEARDPRAGELAVRLAYMIAAANGSVSQQSATVAAQAAALVRDHALAALDLRDLLDDAADQRTDVMTMLAARRAARSFRVEQPPLAPLPADVQREALEAVPKLVRALDTLDRVAAPDRPSAHTTLLNIYFAERLEQLGAERPSVAQVAVTLRTRARVTLRATNEEMLIAARSTVIPANDTVRRANAMALLATAVSLRTMAQDAPWFPGDRGPDAADLVTEFALGGVTFTRGVPVAWRPYYLRELQSSLRDIQRVWPAASLAGLRVRIGNETLRDSALAMHDPRTRTLQLSIASSSGTLAHELAHDLDWQAARRLYANGSGYSSDRAMRERRGTLATSLVGLAEARLLRSLDAANLPASVGRPAEMFARGADWFVASELARQGRTNGFLSVIGDVALAGYAAGQPTATGVAGATSLMSAIGEMTYVPDSARAHFTTQWSDPRAVDPTLLVRRILETPLPFSGFRRPSAAAPVLDATSIDVCTIDDSDESKLRQNVLMLAVEARANGFALRRAKPRMNTPRSDWAKSVLGVAPWSTAEGDRIRASLRTTLLGQLTSAMGDQGLVPLVPAPFCVR